MCRILIVDDDVDTREMLADNLRQAGHSVLLAMNGLCALELLESSLALRTRPCLAVVDLTMPVMDGWELLEALRRDGSWCNLQVIVSSGSELSEKELSSSDKVVVWPKPVQLHKLERIQDQCAVHAQVRV